MKRSYGFTVGAGTVIIFQSKEAFGEAKTANPDLELVTIIENDDLKDFTEIVITQCQGDKRPIATETERIINISELEQKIQNARIHLIAVKEAANGNDSLRNALNAIIKELYECENFDFILEHRKVIRKSLFEILKQSDIE